MSGHSKWSSIKHKKAATDAKRSQLFSKLSKLISVASRAGADPSTNHKLRDVIEQARSFNMPSENIKRAINKGAGIYDKKLEEFLYESYGPGGVAIIIAGITDNSNRTSNEIKHILSINGGKWGETGSVAWAFENEEGKWKPKEYSMVSISAQDEKKLLLLISALDNNEDVQEIYTNKKET